MEQIAQLDVSGAIGRRALASLSLAAVLLAGCGSGDTSSLSANSAQSCMLCHNASLQDDYGGPGIENPHPFGAAANLQCTVCHGGNPDGADKDASHVPPPPEIGVRADWNGNRHAYFNRLTLTGIDRFADYTVNGQVYTAIDYLQFINPGDLRVVTEGRSCGQCHGNHADVVNQSMLATSTGIFSGTAFSIGVDSRIPATAADYAGTAADMGFRAVTDTTFNGGAPEFGDVPSLIEYPLFSLRNDPSPLAIHNNPIYDEAQLLDDRDANNRAITDSPLANLMHEQVAFTCGDCHLGSAGANNRSGDYRSSGCSACHMPYSLGGRSGSTDPNINKFEPLDPDDIDPPELAHVRSHRIMSVAKTLPNGATVEGIDDYACAGCHQGSNRTVMQYWGIRLDQNEDVRRNRQYPANPDSFTRTTNDARLFDPVLGNREFNGRDDDQYLLFEDYDGDTLDDTPPDIHYEAGLGCIDCHGSYDLHGGDTSTPSGERLASRMEHGVAIRCESCHGTVATPVQTIMATAYDGVVREVATDDKGLPLPHVVKETGGFYLYSKLTGAPHYIPQTLDVVVDNSVIHPDRNVPVYSPKASYAMGTFDGSAATGIGPQQTFDGGTPTGFTHAENMDCASCHASWTNTCMGCHLEGEHTNNPNTFSNITGDRIAFREREADFVYQSPLFFQLGVNSRNRITQVSPNTKMFFRWRDRSGNAPTETFTFSDRNGQGSDPGVTAPSLSHNAMMAHSIRGKVDPVGKNEGPRYCVACHLTTNGMAAYGTEYAAFVTALENNDFDALDQPPLGFATVLEDHFGRNTGNQMNSPLWVHMVAGLGSGMFLFDEDGCPVNPLDGDTQRKGCNGAPNATAFSAARVAFNLDRTVLKTGVSTGSSNHPLITPVVGNNLRTGAGNPAMAGPLGSNLVELLADPTNGLILDSWLDADGASHGLATSLVGP